MSREEPLAILCGVGPDGLREWTPIERWLRREYVMRPPSLKALDDPKNQPRNSDLMGPTIQREGAEQ